MLKSGDKVVIYHDPITQECREGRAVLKELRSPDSGDGLSVWLVQFDNEPGALYQRTVKER